MNCAIKHELHDGGTLEVVDSLLTELSIDVVGTQPFNHINVGGVVPVTLNVDSFGTFNEGYLKFINKT